MYEIGFVFFRRAALHRAFRYIFVSLRCTKDAASIPARSMFAFCLRLFYKLRF